MNDLGSTAYAAVRLAAGLALAGVGVESSWAAEDNFWPVKVTQKDAAGSVVSWQGAGPLLFEKPTVDAGKTSDPA